MSVATGALIVIATACSSARFGGNQGAASKNESGSGAPGAATSPTGTPSSADSPGTTASPAPGTTATGGPAACTTDQVKLDWSGDEKACIDKGQTWAFDTGKCMDIRKAAFDCTWANAIAELDKKGLTTQTIKDDSAAGAKLVSCGQSQDGNRIVVQWIKVADGAAQVACTGGASPLQHHITTGCYTFYANGAVPAAATTQAEKDARVYACLSSI
ncbi:MAG: hypothetical protein NTZ90_00245 [Proteobacteria bacterium]|nr:hypothetical protein [Pseudomonadota bacterium]